MVNLLDLHGCKCLQNNRLDFQMSLFVQAACSFDTIADMTENESDGTSFLLLLRDQAI